MPSTCITVLPSNTARSACAHHTVLRAGEAHEGAVPPAGAPRLSRISSGRQRHGDTCSRLRGHRSDADGVRGDERSVTGVTGPPGLVNLPRHTGVFVGRDAELTDLAAALRGGGEVVPAAVAGRAATAPGRPGRAGGDRTADPAHPPRLPRTAPRPTGGDVPPDGPRFRRRTHHRPHLTDRWWSSGSGARVAPHPRNDTVRQRDLQLPAP